MPTMIDVVEWVRRALADPDLTPLRKLLRRRGLPPEVRSSVEAYIEADRDLRAHLKWSQENSCQLSATSECDDIPILAISNQDRWKDGRREQQYEELRGIIEEVGCPLKRELIANGFTDEEISAGITFSLKLTPDGEALEIVSTASQLDYDPGDPDRWAAEFDASRRGGCDRRGIWHPVFTLCGRVHGYFEENESREFERLWVKKYHHWPRPDVLLRDRVSVTLTATASDKRYYDTRPREAREKMQVSRKAAEEARASRALASAPSSGPTFSASFLDFAEGTNPPIRFERGEPSPDGRRSRAVDRETGEYVEFFVPHWQDSTRDYSLYLADGTKICTATVQQEALDLSGDFKVGLYKVRILSIRQPAADRSWREITDPASPVGQKLAHFIAAFWLDNPARHSVAITFDLGGGVI